jgi:phage replication-related protein YjqB (UPF0714/DUF867 family)
MVLLSTDTRAVLSQDATNVALNRVGHAVEHCAVDAGSLGVLGSAVGRQVLVRRSCDGFALYTIAEGLDASGPAVHVGTSGAGRLRSATGAVAPLTAVTLETAFVSSDDEAPARLTEELLGDDAADWLAILAPHGGHIETGTDIQARLVHDVLAQRNAAVRAWIARGFNPTAGAHTCWHIPSSELSEHSFPKLGTLFIDGCASGAFAHAVAFHGHNDSETIVIGGGLPRSDAHTELKLRLRSTILRALETVTDHPAPVEVRRCGPLSGAEPDNIVNRVAVAGNGIQLEQPLAVRRDKRQRATIARAVADFYWSSHGVRPAACQAATGS